MHGKIKILVVIVVSQFCCTSLWFAGNAVMNDLIRSFSLDLNALGHLTSAVQFGFIVGTLLFALLTIADRFPPSLIFFISAVAGAICNLGIMLEGNTLLSLLLFRFSTGFFLAGIYPIGMKIAADYFDKGLGKSLGYLVGALVLGTALPHLLKGVTSELPWRLVLVFTSSAALCGGLLMFFLVPDGPFRKKGGGLELTAFFVVFKNKKFRSAAFGYFGHMWELYAFWAFVPVMLTAYSATNPYVEFNIPVLSFVIIGIGCIACIVGGYLSEYISVKNVASYALFLSGVCCVISPFIFKTNSSSVLVTFLVFWGIVVVADSPMFSTLIAQNAPAHSKGTALTIVNCIGFSITIISIQTLTIISSYLPFAYLFVFLAVGPVLGLLAFRNSSMPQVDTP